LQLVTDDDSSSILAKLLEDKEMGAKPENVLVGIDGGGNDGIPGGCVVDESSCIRFRCLKNVCHIAA
jgi:hypothetical protein